MEHLPIKYRHFLGLLRLGIGAECDIFQSSEQIDWPIIHRLAEEHCVIGLCYAGIERLHREMRPPLPVLMNWFQQTEELTRQYASFESSLAELAHLLHAQQIPYVVFKGLAVANLYPKPSVRQNGDIDFYVPPSYFRKALEVIEQSFNVEINKNCVDKHHAFNFQSVRFEIHFQLETFGNSKHQQRFDAMLDSDINTILPNFEIRGEKIPMLPPTTDLILLFKHWFNHLLGEGIGIRQTTDIAQAIKCYRDKIDVKTLQHRLRDIGYIKAFDAVIALVEEYYGISWEEYWKESPSLPRFRAKTFAEKLMSDVFRNGNFGRSDYKHHRGLLKRLETFFRFTAHSCRYFPLAANDILFLVPRRILIALKSFYI